MPIGYRGAGFQYKVADGGNRSVMGGNRSVLLNKSNVEISCINNKSECISDNDISQYVSKDKKTMRKNERIVTEVPYVDRDLHGIISSTFDKNEAKTARLIDRTDDRSRTRTPRATYKDEAFSYKALMELKGSKCKCVHSIYMQPLLDQTTISNNDITCGTYCKRLGPKAQNRIVLDLLAKGLTSQGNEAEPKRYLINQKWWS